MVSFTVLWDTNTSTQISVVDFSFKTCFKWLVTLADTILIVEEISAYFIFLAFG